MHPLSPACVALAQNPIAAEDLAASVLPVVRRLAAKFYDPDEVAQRALIKILRYAPRCRARTPGRLLAWLRRVVSGCGCDLIGSYKAYEPLDDFTPERRPQPDPTLGRAIALCLREAPRLSVAGLSGPRRTWARRMRVSASAVVRARHLHCLVRLRMDATPSEVIAKEIGATAAAVKTYALRGASLLQITALVLSEEKGDLLFTDALLRIARGRPLK